MFYVWYIILEPDFDSSLNKELMQQLKIEIMINFNYCNVEFGLRRVLQCSYWIYCFELTSWYF